MSQRSRQRRMGAIVASRLSHFPSGSANRRTGRVGPRSHGSMQQLERNATNAVAMVIWQGSALAKGKAKDSMANHTGAKKAMGKAKEKATAKACSEVVMSE